jgi:tetratricopeptide (TPR) repeat protein
VQLAAEDEPLFDAGELFAEAQMQFSAGEFSDAAETLDAVMAVDPNFRSDEVNALMLQSLTRQAETLLRSGNPDNLSVGIVNANEAAAYGDIGELSYESYIAGLYLNAQSREGNNLQGAIEGYSAILAQAPNYMDVRQKIFDLRVELGDLYYTAFDFCPAVVQYQAALQLFTRPDLQTKLDASLTSCPNTPAGSVGGGVVPNVTPSGVVTTQPVIQPTSEGVAPIGER